jgi:hypothetical protein
MIFNEYSDQVKGAHAFLSPSNYHWTNYDLAKLETTYRKRLATDRGTKLHAFAAEAITLGIKLAKSKSSINMYVNDAIGFKMRPEQILFYSENAFGTADAISFRDGLLRIHDLKTGESPVSIKQLEVYTAYFCLEYKKKPKDISVELRIYQAGDVIFHKPHYSEIERIMKITIEFDKHLKKIQESLEE